jgi:lauroyl/myristoyl acyltransferase
MALLILYKHVVKMPTTDTPVPPRIAENTKFTLYFDNCISVLDGSYISLMVEPEKQAPYRNRKGFLSQNVLAAYTFDL